MCTPIVSRAPVTHIYTLFFLALCLLATPGFSFAAGPFEHGNVISLQADTGKWLARCDSCQNMTTVAASYHNTAGVHVGDPFPSYARFRVFDAGSGKIALQADTGKFLARCRNCVVKGQSDIIAIHVNNFSPAYAKFTPKLLSNGKYALIADTGKYVARCHKCSPGATISDTATIHVNNPSGAYAQWRVKVQATQINEYPISPVSIQPVLFIPKNRIKAVAEWSANQKNLEAYLKVARRKWWYLLGGWTTFNYAPTITVFGNKSSSAYASDSNIFGAIQGEVLQHLNQSVNLPATANVCNYNRILLLLVAGGNDITIGTGGNWCSYAVFNGPGAAIMGIDYFYAQGKLTSTLVHEIGHTFGLVHSWERPKGCATGTCATAQIAKYSKDNGTTVMSYNQSHWTNSTNIVDVKGNLLPVELFELSHNRRTIPFLQFNQKLTAAEASYSSIFLNPQKPLSAPYDINSMWQTPNVNAQNWASLPIILPSPMKVDRIVVSTGAANTQIAKLLQVEYRNSSGKFVFRKRVSGSSGVANIKIPLTWAQEWKIALQANNKKNVFLRGVKFYRGNRLLYPK